MNKVQYYTQIRDDALARGDMGIARAVTADLRRWVVSEESSSTPTMEAKRKSGRPKLPRCEHGQIAYRCASCNDEMGLVNGDEADE